MIEETENQEQSLEDLIELVERDDLPTNIYTNETTDPMVLLGKINEVIGYLRTLQGTIESSDTKATQALASAIQALETANTALSSSSTALTNANQALSTANNAISSANTAVETANTASTTATEAKQTAEGIAETANQALSTANNASATANNANATANTANTTATEAKQTATEAKQTATEAKQTANSASTTAVNANITANNANSTAQQALTTAQGKQDALSQTQLNAVNSGINSTKVAEIDNKVEQITQPSMLYGTDSYGDQTTYAISTGALGIVQRQASSGNITVPATPSSNNDATSKSYVDTLISKVFKTRNWVSDCNLSLDETNNGIYEYTNTTLHRPSIADWGTLLQFGSVNYGLQIAFGNYYSNGWWAFRRWDPGNSTWTNWEVRT